MPPVLIESEYNPTTLLHQNAIFGLCAYSRVIVEAFDATNKVAEVADGQNNGTIWGAQAN